MRTQNNTEWGGRALKFYFESFNYHHGHARSDVSVRSIKSMITIHLHK